MTCLKCNKPLNKGRKYCSVSCAVRKNPKPDLFHKKTNQYGYCIIYVPNHPKANNSGYVLEHRYIMEQKIGRYLSFKEIIHHINEIRNDNRIENLELTNRQSHAIYHFNFINKKARKKIKNNKNSISKSVKEYSNLRDSEINERSDQEFYSSIKEDSEIYHLGREFIKTFIDLHNECCLPISSEEETIELSFEDHLKARLKVIRIFYLVLTIYIMAKD